MHVHDCQYKCTHTHSHLLSYFYFSYLIFLGHFSSIWAIDFSKDGSKLLSASADHSVRMWSESMADPIFAEVEREELHEKEIVDEIEKDLQEDDGSNVQQACLPTNTSLGYAETILMVLNSEKFNEDPALQNELKIKIQNMGICA